MQGCGRVAVIVQGCSDDVGGLLRGCVMGTVRVQGCNSQRARGEGALIHGVEVHVRTDSSTIFRPTHTSQFKQCEHWYQHCAHSTCKYNAAEQIVTLVFSPPMQVGVVQTAYANGASTHYLRHKLSLKTVCTKTGACGRGPLACAPNMLLHSSGKAQFAVCRHLRLMHNSPMQAHVPTSMSCRCEAPAPSCPRL